MGSAGLSVGPRGLGGAAALALMLAIAACSAPGATASLTPSASAPASAAASSSLAPLSSSGTSSGATVAARVSFETAGAAPGKDWSSITWTKLAGGSPLLSIRAVVQWRGGYVAYGGNGLWDSPDGRAWTQSVTALPADRMVVAETASGLVALAFDGPVCPEATEPCRPASAGPVAAWTSIDGLNWTDRGAAVGITESQLMAVGGGPMGAVASTVDGNQSGLWFSADGVTWKAVSVPSISSASWCSSAAFGGGKYVMLCPASKETAFGDLPTQPVWSADGVNWVAGSAPATSDRPAGMDKVLAGRAGFMATGFIPGEGGPEQWWRSTDATSWQIVAGYSPVGTYTSHAIPGGTYADGWLCADGTRLVAFALDSSHSSLSGDGWTSADGKSWAKLTSHGRPQAGEFAEIVFPTGVLAGGYWGAAS